MMIAAPFRRLALLILLGLGVAGGWANAATTNAPTPAGIGFRSGNSASAATSSTYQRYGATYPTSSRPSRCASSHVGITLFGWPRCRISTRFSAPNGWRSSWWRSWWRPSKWRSRR